MGKINRFFAHLINNTLWKRIKYQFSDLRKWDNMKAGKRKFVIYKLTKQTKLKLYPDSYLSYLILRGDFERNELAFFEQYLKKGNIFIDIGANVGLFSLLASEKGCQVYSGMDAWNNLSTEANEEGFIKVKINTDTLDNFIQSHFPEFNQEIIIKMDVEGWEKFVITGGKKSLKNGKFLLMIEFNDENFLKNDYSGQEIISMMSELDYSFFEWKNNRLVPHVNREKYEYTNLIAIKNKFNS